MPSFAVIDADAHVLEPESMWPEYLDAAFRSRAPRRVLDNKGRSRQVMADEFMAFIPISDHSPTRR